MSDNDHPYALAGEGGGIPAPVGTICPYDEWSVALMDAINSDDHTVELVAAANGDAQVEIDGVPMLEGVAYPPQQFTVGGCKDYLTSEGLAKVQEIAETVANDGDSE